MDGARLGRRKRPRNLSGFMREWLGNSHHLWMWDEAAMADRLATHGFTQIRRCDYGDAPDRRFLEVEEPGRFGGCLAMECRKAG